MNNKEVLIEFYEQIDIFLKQHNFNLDRTNSVAKRKTKFGFDSLFFDANNMIDSYSITTDIRIRHNTIQEIKGEINPRYKNRKETSTVLITVFSLLKYYNRLDLDYEIENPGNLVNAKTLKPYLDSFERFMNEIGFSFFKNFETIQDFDDWFNLPILYGTYDFEKGMNWNNSICGLISAKLSNNPRYEEIHQQWLKGISKNDTETLTELALTKQYLDNIKSDNR